MVKVLVTGGNGWIGSSVCRELESREVEAVAFDTRSGKDIRNPNDLEIVSECNAVIHLAGVLGTHELFDHPKDATDINVTGTLNVLEACRRYGASYTSIVMPKVNPSLYSVTKNAAMDMADVYRKTFNIPVSHVIAYNAYGPGQAFGPHHPQKIIPTFATRCWEERPIPIWGNGQLWVDLVYVDDVARMLVDATGFSDGEVFDAGTGEPLTVRSTAQFVQAIAGDYGIEWLPERPGERTERTTNDYASGRGWGLLGWKPRLDFALLKETVLSYQ